MGAAEEKDQDFQMETALPATPGTCSTTPSSTNEHAYEEAWKEDPVIFQPDEEELFDATEVQEFYPDWSWDRVRPWCGVRRPDDFTDEQIEAIAANDVVYLGSLGAQTHGTVEAGNRAAAARIKAVDSQTINLFYWNSMINYDKYEANETFDAEAWALRDPETDELVKFRDRYYWYDHTNADFREWWITIALGMLDDPNIDGVFIDAIAKTRFFGYRDEKGHLVPNPDGEAAYMETAKELRSRLPPGKLLIGNALRAKTPNGNAHHLTYLDGSYLENWHDDPETTVRSIELMSAALKIGRIVMLNSGPTVGLRRRRRLEQEEILDGYDVEQKYAYMQEKISFPLGVFLLVNDPFAYMQYAVGVNVSPKGKAAFDSRRIKEFVKKIGKPKGKLERKGMVFKRRFENVRVRVNIQSSNANIVWLGQNDNDDGDDDKQKEDDDSDGNDSDNGDGDKQKEDDDSNGNDSDNDDDDKQKEDDDSDGDDKDNDDDDKHEEDAGGGGDEL